MISSVDQKTPAAMLDGTPDKRLYWSIMVDYDFPTAIIELVDNSFDIWIRGGRESPLKVEIDLDIERQLVRIVDNAGGVKGADLPLLITPGGSANDPYGQSIGVFGVGSKRAVVAIAEHIVIRTRYASQQSYQIDIDPEWLESQTWSIRSHLIPDIAEGTTLINFSHLRTAIRREDEVLLRERLGETYGLLLQQGSCQILLNKEPVNPITFESWAFPPDNAPHVAYMLIEPERGREVAVEVKSGLIRDRDHIGDNYGVYIYCNDRLVVKELKSKDVGYHITGQSGRPHPDASLCRTIVSFAGPARLMPWNSSKSDIMPSSITFQLVSELIIRMNAHFTKLSRALKDDWEGTVFRYDQGSIVEVPAEQASNPRKMVFPPVPAQRRARIVSIKESNKRQIDRAPYIVGLIEAVSAVDVVMRQHFETGNRIALILLDSTFEIAVKEYLVHDRHLFGREKVDNVLGNRTDSIAYLRSKVDLDDDIFTLAEHYYELRNKLVHERATVNVSDEDINRYRNVVARLLSSLYYVVW